MSTEDNRVSSKINSPPNKPTESGESEEMERSGLAEQTNVTMDSDVKSKRINSIKSSAASAIGKAGDDFRAKQSDLASGNEKDARILTEQEKPYLGPGQKSAYHKETSTATGRREGMEKPGNDGHPFIPATEGERAEAPDIMDAKPANPNKGWLAHVRTRAKTGTKKAKNPKPGKTKALNLDVPKAGMSPQESKESKFERAKEANYQATRGNNPAVNVPKVKRKKGEVPKDRPIRTKREQLNWDAADALDREDSVFSGGMDSEGHQYDTDADGKPFNPAKYPYIDENGNDVKNPDPKQMKRLRRKEVKDEEGWDSKGVVHQAKNLHKPAGAVPDKQLKAPAEMYMTEEQAARRKGTEFFYDYLRGKHRVEGEEQEQADQEQRMTSDERNDPAREYMARKKAEMDGKNVEQENQEAIARAERKAGQTQGQTAAQNLEREFSQMRNAEKGMTPRERMEQHHNRAGVRLEEKDYQNLKSFMDVFKQQNPDERTLIRLVYGPMKYGPRFTMPEFGAPQSAKAPGDDTQYATKTPIDDMLNRWGTAVQVDPQIIQAYSDYAALQIPGLKDQLTPDKWLNQRWQLFDARTNEPVEIEIGDGWYPVKSYQIENLEQGWKPKDDRLESLTFAHDILSEVAPQLDPNGQYVVRVVGSEDEGRTDFVQQDDVTQPAYTMSVHENQANQAEADQDLTENDRPLSPDETRDHIQELDQFKDSIKIPGNEIEGSQMPDIMGLLRNKGQKGIDRNIDPTEYFEYADVKNDQYPKMIGKPYYTPDGTWELVPLPKPRFGMYEWVKGPSRGRGLPPTWTLKPTYEDKSGWADPEYEDAYDIKTKWKSNKTPASKGMSTRFNPYEGRHVLEQDEAPVRGQESLNALSEKKESKKKGAEEKAKQPEVAPVRGKKDDFTPKTPKDIKAEKEKRKKSMKERAGKHVESEQEKYAPVRGAR